MPVQGSFGNYYEYHNQGGIYEFWDDRRQTPEQLAIIDLAINDDFNQTVDFEGVPWYITLLVMV